MAVAIETATGVDATHRKEATVQPLKRRDRVQCHSEFGGRVFLRIVENPELFGWLCGDGYLVGVGEILQRQDPGLST